MIKDFFQKNIQLQNQLRSQHFKTQQYLQKGKYRMKQKFFSGGKKHYDFDMNSQQYFHQYVDDIMFEHPQIQQIFINHITKSMQNIKPKQCQQKQQMPVRRNPYETRLELSKHFRNRITDLVYKKYLLLLRSYNASVENQLEAVKSRVLLIQKEVQCLRAKQMRLECQDMFQQSYTQGGKPVPINQSGQPIYKYLDEQQCWFSNITRQDIISYSRRKNYLNNCLDDSYWSLHYELKDLVFIYGINIHSSIEQQLAKQRKKLKQYSEKQSIRLIQLIEKGIQQISPGNLIEKQNISSFIFHITGVSTNNYIKLPIYPSIFMELLDNVNQILPTFFINLKINTHKQLITLLPKFNTFNSIIFKYQNKQILQGKKQIKLGLDDDIDAKKQLITMLEQLWVNKFIKINFDRFQYKLSFKGIDWPMDTYTLEKQRQNKKLKQQLKPDKSIQQIIKILSLNQYGTFRKHMKKRSQDIIDRAKLKYKHMQQISKYNIKSTQTITLQNLSQIYKTKLIDNGEQPQILKLNALKIFNTVLAEHFISNPAQIQVIQTMKCIQMRQTRTKIMNIFNGMRCYHRNICFDLRVMSGQQFSFHLDDKFLINSNKQSIQNFQKQIKQNQTYFSKVSGDNFKLPQQQFLIKNEHNISMLYKKDIVHQQFFNQTIPHIIVNDGQKPKNSIIYQIVINDMKDMQIRILNSITKYVNRYQRIIKVKKMPEIVDRVELLRKIYGLQLKYCYEKFKLLQQYYYIYENTSQPLQAFKIAKIIIELLYKYAEIDDQQESFIDSYELAIEQLNQQTKSLKLFRQILYKTQQEKNKSFHKHFAEKTRIPLTLYGYLYGDIDATTKIQNRMQRMNSVNSIMSLKSKHSKEDKMQENQKIDEQQNESNEQQTFNIQKYDQYMLQRDMDKIFEDMVQEDNHKQNAPINTVSMQNVVVNPRFQGGPHPISHRIMKLKLTSNYQERLTNFSDIMFWSVNLRALIQDLVNQFVQSYGYCSKLYKLAIRKIISDYILKTIYQPQNNPPKSFQFSTLDPYLQVVTKSMKYYEQIMAPSLDPPPQSQLLMHNVLKIHQDKLYPYTALQFFDYHTIKQLIMLKKPTNTVNYKQIVLGINFLELLQLNQKIYHVQLRRKRISRAYKVLGNHSDAFIDKFGMQYARVGTNPVFLATQQLKIYNPQIYSYPVFPQAIQQIRLYTQCELADITLFRTVVQISKLHLENYIIMKLQADKQFVNGRLDKTRIISNDAKNIKMIKNRLNGLVSVLGSQRIKSQSFFKCKSRAKTQFERNFQQISDYNKIQQILGQQKNKINLYCQSILQDKYKSLLTKKAIKLYIEDILATVVRNNVIINTEYCLRKLHNLGNSIPFLSKLFTKPHTNVQVEKKVFYDQKISKQKLYNYTSLFEQGNITNFFYLYSRQQLMQQWMQLSQLSFNTHSTKFNINQNLDVGHPTDKNQLFQWIFRVKQNQLTSSQKQALRHYLRVAQPFTGTNSQTFYSTSDKKQYQPPRNKFLTLHEHYKTILQYLNINVQIISLQLQEDIYESFDNLLKRNRNFEETFPQINQNTAYEQLESTVIAPCFVYQSQQQKIIQTLKQSIEDKHYLQSKQHWIIIDQTIDFLVSKVQGFGVMRQSFLPLYEQIKKCSGQPKDKFKKFLSERTKTLYLLLWLSFWQTYATDSISNKNSDFHQYVLQGMNAYFNEKPVELFKINTDTNYKININKYITKEQSQKERFNIKLYNHSVNSLIHKIKPLYMIVPINIEKYLIGEMKRYENIENNAVDCYENYRGNLFQDGINIFKSIGTKNRLNLFARIRLYNDQINNYLLSKPKNLHYCQKQSMKHQYTKFLTQTKINMLSIIIFQNNIDFTKNSQTYRTKQGQIHEIVDTNGFYICDHLQQYKSHNKIQFGKTQMQLIGNTTSLTNNNNNDSKSDQQQKKYLNKIIQQIIYNKLIREQFKTKILQFTIKNLKNQKYPVNQQKKIINTSLIPRVHLIASYCSPLVVDRKTYISQQYKLAFIQAFVNRFRNKVSRVDLLSSGYGFVITVPDLQDCLNFLNKLFFTFTEKQFKCRLQTFSQYFDIMHETIQSKNRKLIEQQSLINYLKDKVNNVFQAQYLGKVSKLLLQKTLIQDKLQQVQRASKGLQDRVRKAVQLLYEKRIQSITKQNQQLKRQFLQFKKLFVILTKDATKNNFLGILNNFKGKINHLLSKQVDFATSFVAIQNTDIKTEGNKKVQENPPNYVRKQKKQQYQQQQEGQDFYAREDLQYCKLGEDIIHDPYYVTKLINKMRIFNLFKMGSKRVKYEEQKKLKQNQYSELQKIQDTVISQSQRQTIMRQELIKAQQQLSRKCLELQQAKNTCETLENEKTKLKILLTSKDKKMQQKDREIEDLKKSSFKKDITSMIDMTTVQKSKQDPMEKQRQRSRQKQQLPRISAIRQRKKQISRKLERISMLNKTTTIQHQISGMSAYDKFELSNKDSTWRQKCEQLYVENKKLLAQLQKFQTGATTPARQVRQMRQGYSLPMRNQQRSAADYTSGLSTPITSKDNNKKKISNLSYKYNLVKQNPYNF